MARVLSKFVLATLTACRLTGAWRESRASASSSYTKGACSLMQMRLLALRTRTGTITDAVERELKELNAPTTLGAI